MTEQPREEETIETGTTETEVEQTLVEEYPPVDDDEEATSGDLEDEPEE